MSQLTPDHEKKEQKKTEILYGVEDAVGQGLRFMSNVKKQMDICFDSKGPSIVVKVDAYRNGYIDIRKRGGKIRAFTEITKDNIHDCKELAKIVDELRHLDGVKGGIAINEDEYMATTCLEEGKPLTQVIYSNAPAMVKQGQYIFDTLWSKAIPAEYKIREIEDGIEPEIIETISDPYRVKNMAFELASSAKNEILGIFSTSNAFRRQERTGLIPMLAEMAKVQDIQIRVMTPIDDAIKDAIEKWKGKLQQKVEIRNIEPPLRTRVSLLLVDRKYSLAVEVKDDAKDTTVEAIGLATYSNSKATVLSYASIFESLWNQAELYERIRQLYEQLKAYSEMQKEFINIAAHELRTPIQPIIGLTEILCQKESGSDSNSGGEYRKLLKIINRNANRLNTLTENLLDVAKIESQSLRLDKEAFLLNDVIADVVADVEKSIDANKVRLLFLCPGRRSIFINADRGRIIQAMYNLLSNAVKFSEGGTVFVTLEEETNDAGQFAIISVKDSGSGIDPEIVSKLFTKFASKSEKGTGLGLYITKGIVETHGGKIWAKNNKEGRGATFAFSLPLAAGKHAG
ncbi:MAG: HAMP domain-containing sensor histidine kinase [Nitrososphaera sp.]